jgi:hypothetical protein
VRRDGPILIPPGLVVWYPFWCRHGRIRRHARGALIICWPDFSAVWYIGISAIEVTLELAWELATCYEHKTKLLLTCDIGELDSALHCIRVVVPDAVILPADFRNVEKLRTVGKPGVAIVQLLTYGQVEIWNGFTLNLESSSAKSV